MFDRSAPALLSRNEFKISSRRGRPCVPFEWRTPRGPPLSIYPWNFPPIFGPRFCAPLIPRRATKYLPSGGQIPGNSGFTDRPCIKETPRRVPKWLWIGARKRWLPKSVIAPRSPSRTPICRGWQTWVHPPGCMVTVTYSIPLLLPRFLCLFVEERASPVV